MSAIHMGKGVRRAREAKDWTQETLASQLGEAWDQKKVSALEKKQTIDEPTLDKLAKALDVKPEDLRNFTSESSFTINHNHVSDHGVANNIGQDMNIVNQIKDIIEHVSQLTREHKKEVIDLYERLLAAEKEKHK